MNTQKLASLLSIALVYALTIYGEAVASDRNENVPRFVTVICEAPGMSAVDVEGQVTYPLEVALLGTPGVLRTSAESRAGETVISVEFDHKTPILRARQLVAEKLKTFSEPGWLPKAVKTKLAPISSGRFLLIALRASELPDDDKGRDKLAMQLRDIATGSLRHRLMTITGVSQVTLTGGVRQQCEVTLSPEKLTAFALTATEVVSALKKANADVEAAARSDGTESIVRGLGQLQSVEDIANAVIAVRDEKPIFVKDVAAVHVTLVDEFGDLDRVLKPKTIEAARQGAVLSIALQPDADVTKLGKNVDEVLDATRKTLPEGTQIGKTIDESLEPLVDQFQRVLRRELPPEMDLRREKSDELGEMLVATASQRSVLKLFGSDLAVLLREAAKCRKIIAKVPGVVDARFETRTVDPQLDIRPNRKAIASHGLTIGDVLDECHLALGGHKVSTVTLNDRPCDLVVKNQQIGDAPMFADKIRVRSKSGELIPLVRLVAIHIKAVPRNIHSEDSFRVVRVSFNTKDRNMTNVRDDIRTKVEKAVAPIRESLDEGYRIRFGWK